MEIDWQKMKENVEQMLDRLEQKKNEHFVKEEEFVDIRLSEKE